MNYDFDTLPDRRLSESVKWNKFGADVLPLWVADMDFRSPPEVVQALHARVEHGVFGYPLGSRPGDLPELRGLIVERLAQRYGWHIDPDDILFQPGVGTAFKLASLAFASPERALLVQTPLYPPLLGLAKTTAVLGREAELVRQPDGEYCIDFDLFEAAAREGTGLFLLCNPHNPSGRVFRRDELERMAEICLRHEVVICSDEIHCDLVFSGQRHIPMASLDPEVASRTITLMAPSKTFNLAGLKFSFTIVQDAELRRRFLSAGFGLGGWANLMGLTAAQAAYQYGGEWLAQLMVYLEGNRDFLDSFVRRELPGVSMAAPEGTYLSWLDCRGMRVEGSPCEFFMEAARVALGDGREFGPGGEGFVRLNFGCPRAVLEEALQRMRGVVKTL
jgi:cystathionine beta-lyase